MSTGSTGEWVPTTNEMPDIADLNPKLSLAFMLNRFFGGSGPTNKNSYALVMNFIRVVDLLVDEYKNARERLSQFTNRENNTVMSPLYFATGSFENAVTTMARAIKFAQRIRNDRNGPEVARRLVVLSGDVFSRVNGMRNAIEHLDNKIVGQTLGPNDFVCLILTNQKALAEDIEIQYSEFATWIRDLHALASELLKYKEGNQSSST
jgi:hypothetical protein